MLLLLPYLLLFSFGLIFDSLFRIRLNVKKLINSIFTKCIQMVEVSNLFVQSCVIVRLLNQNSRLNFSSCFLLYRWNDFFNSCYSLHRSTAFFLCNCNLVESTYIGRSIWMVMAVTFDSSGVRIEILFDMARCTTAHIIIGLPSNIVIKLKLGVGSFLITINLLPINGRN